jgi:hypothetical protein
LLAAASFPGNQSLPCRWVEWGTPQMAFLHQENGEDGALGPNWGANG